MVSSTTVALICGSLLLTLGVWHLLQDPDSTVKHALDNYYAEGRKVMDDYSASVERRMHGALEQLFVELDDNRDGTIQRSEFKGAVIGVMAALKAMDNERPRLPQLALPSYGGGILHWVQVILTLQLTFLVLLFVLEHLRAVFIGDVVTVDLASDYTHAKPERATKDQALRYSTPLSGPYEKAKMVFFICTGLAFLRIALAIFFFFCGCICVALSVIGGRSRRRNPQWFAFWRFCLTIFGNLIMCSIGFSRVVVHGAPAKDRDRKIMVANHVCVIEVVYLFVHNNMPSFVSRIENLSVPLFGSVCRACDAILVNRDAAESRSKTLESILERARTPSSPPVMIFPEGTCNGQAALFQFRRGAFEARQPVQMVCFKYPYTHFNPCWTGRPSGGLDLADLVVRLACQFVNRMEVVYLPVYTPTAEETADATLYAAHVQSMIASVIGVPVSDATYADYVEKAKEYAAKKRAYRDGSVSPQPSLKHE